MADAAGDILRKTYRQPITVDLKSDTSPVTQADREVESAMRNLIEAHYPEHGIVGEEFGNIRPGSPFQWVLDPIDGTRSFIGGYPLFTTLISLVHEGIPVLGIIYQPISGERWLGLTAQNTTLNKKAVTTRATQDLAASVLATTSIDYFTAEQTDIFKELRKQCANTILGGDAYAYAMLASGHIDIVVDAGLKTYDFCALKPVIEGAGGIITDWKGAPLTLASDGRVLAAANSTLHKAALAQLR